MGGSEVQGHVGLHSKPGLQETFFKKKNEGSGQSEANMIDGVPGLDKEEAK